MKRTTQPSEDELISKWRKLYESQGHVFSPAIGGRKKFSSSNGQKPSGQKIPSISSDDDKGEVKVLSQKEKPFPDKDTVKDSVSGFEDLLNDKEGTNKNKLKGLDSLSGLTTETIPEVSNGNSESLQKRKKHSGRELLPDNDDSDMYEVKDPISGFDESRTDEESIDKDNLKVLDSMSELAPKTNAKPNPKLLSGDESHLSQTRFDQCAVSPLSLKGIKDAGYERMTIVQEATLPVILKGKDVLAKARTGTGKTIAFLLPAIEEIIKSPSMNCDQKGSPVTVLVICPTRELALQVAAEATKLLKHHPSIGAQVVIGGACLTLERKLLKEKPCQILIATPGRFKDHTKTTPGFASQLMGVKVLILDEADQLLDMGFQKDIEAIVASVPKQRQTLLFSATVPREVHKVCRIVLKNDHVFIDTVDNGSEETHSQVRQTHLIASLNEHFSLIYTLLKDHIAEDAEYKVLVFCTTAMITRFVANLLSDLHLNVLEIHSRKSQSVRTKVSDEFRESRGLILVTSDVSARGVDYPDVTLVIQVGLPFDRQQYIHRLGRTGRTGKHGQGILLLAPFEEFFLSKVKDLPLTKASVPVVDSTTKKKVEQALSKIKMKFKEAAYQSWLGFYNYNKTVGRDKCKLVELANEFSRSMGLDIPPSIRKVILGRMNLRNVPGLRSR